MEVKAIIQYNSRTHGIMSQRPVSFEWDIKKTRASMSPRMHNRSKSQNISADTAQPYIKANEVHKCRHTYVLFSILAEKKHCHFL